MKCRTKYQKETVGKRPKEWYNEHASQAKTGAVGRRTWTEENEWHLSLKAE